MDIKKLNTELARALGFRAEDMDRVCKITLVIEAGKAPLMDVQHQVVNADGLLTVTEMLNLQASPVDRTRVCVPLREPAMLEAARRNGVMTAADIRFLEDGFSRHCGGSRAAG